MLKQNAYKRNLHQNKRADGLTLDKYSEHDIDVKNQIHREKSKYVVYDGLASRVFHRTETLRYYEPKQITSILEQIGFPEIYLFDRNTCSHLTDFTTGVYVIAKN